MPRAMVHPRLKQRIISDPPSATASPESGHPVDTGAAADQGAGADADMADEAGDPAEDVDDEGGSMNISDNEDVGDVVKESQGYEPGSLSRGHALSRFNPQKPASSSQNNNKNLKGSASASGSTSASHTATMADQQQDNVPGTQPRPSEQPDSVRRSSRVKPPSSPSKPAPVSQRSPARKSLKIKLKLGSKPTPELDDEKPTPPSTVTRSGGIRRGRSSRTRGRGKDSATLTFTLPARGRNTRSEASVSSRRSQSLSETSPRTSPESEDDPDAEIDIEPDLEAEAEDVNVDDETMGVGSIDEYGEDDDSEVLPGQGSKPRMTSRQALLARKADVEHVELGIIGSSRKKQLTTEEMALRREETARKRKNLNEKKLEDEKTETINRLLKKQSSRSRAKRSALNASLVATPQTHSGGEEGETDQISPEKPSGMPGPAWRWISSKDGYKLGIPIEVIEGATLEPPPPPPPPPPPSASICDVQGCSQSRKYRLVSDFNRSACGIEHLKLLSEKT